MKRSFGFFSVLPMVLVLLLGSGAFGQFGKKNIGTTKAIADSLAFSGTISGQVYIRPCLPWDPVAPSPMWGVVILRGEDAMSASTTAMMRLCCPPSPGCPCDSTKLLSPAGANLLQRTRLAQVKGVTVYHYSATGLPPGKYRIAIVSFDSEVNPSKETKGKMTHLAYATKAGTYVASQAEWSSARIVTISAKTRTHKNVDLYYSEMTR